MSRCDKLAVFLSILTIGLTWWISDQVFERLPHMEDEMAYVWQAQIAARGDLTLASPPCPRCFLVPFVVDTNGLRFGKYPPGWPAVLSLGIRSGLRDWVNPLLAGLAVWWLYRLGKKLAGEKTGLLAAGLLVSSPFFLMNSSSLLSHAWTLLLTLLLIHAWLDAFFLPQRMPAFVPLLAAGLSIGLLALTRPLTAVGVCLPFLLHGLYLLVHGPAHQRKSVLVIGLIGGLLAGLLFLWQYAVTGSPLLNPYTLWWPYDTLGFGPGVGLQTGGYQPIHALWNARVSLNAGASDLFGWANLSWIFLPFGLIALRRSRPVWLIAAILPALVLVYGFYWIGSWTFGPRYYYEALPAAALLTAAGLAWLAGNFTRLADPRQRQLGRLRFSLVTGLAVFLVACNALYYLPIRLGGMVGLYGVSRKNLQPFLSQTAQGYTPALVIVHPQLDWIEYGNLLALSSPYLDTPFIFIHDRSPADVAQVLAAFPDRRVIHYYPALNTQFYNSPLPEVNVSTGSQNQP